METKVKIRESRDYNIGFAETVDIESTENYVSITRFHMLGKEASLDMIRLTPTEAKELSEALNNIVREHERAGRI